LPLPIHTAAAIFRATIPSQIDRQTIHTFRSRRPTRGLSTRAFPALGQQLRRIDKVASVYDRVVEIVAEQLGAEKEKISKDTHFVNDLSADSLDVVELVMELEEEFDINIPDDAAEKIQTIGQAVDYIEKAQQSVA
jgi:acyl carrier protein